MSQYALMKENRLLAKSHIKHVCGRGGGCNWGIPSSDGIPYGLADFFFFFFFLIFSPSAAKYAISGGQTK